jgi:hypothetical protein
MKYTSVGMSIGFVNSGNGWTQQLQPANGQGAA